MKYLIKYLLMLIVCFVGGFIVNCYLLSANGVFDITLMTDSTTLSIGGVLFACYVLYSLLQSTNKRPGDDVDPKGPKQFYDSRWVTERELKTKKQFRYSLYSNLRAVKKDGIVIRSELRGSSLHVNMYKPIHTLVIGTTGSGKTEGYINPSIQILSSCGSKPCLVITDPKGELYNKNARKLEEEGYELKVLDLRNPFGSTRWNPMDSAYVCYQRALHLEDEVEIFKGVNPQTTKYKTITKEYFSEWYGFNGIAYPTKDELKSDLDSTKAKLINEAENYLHDIAISLCPIQSKTDSSWERGAQDFLWGVMLAMLEDSGDPELKMTRERFNLYNVAKIASIKDNDPDNPFGTLKNYFLGRPITSKAASLVATAINNAPNTTKSYMGIVTSSLGMFQDSGICFATSANEMNFETFTDRPTCLIIKVPDEQETRHPIATMCILQMYKKLIDKANQTANLELPRNVYFLLDEFANLPKIEKFDSLITVGRSRKIFFSLVVQSYSQLDSKYGAEDAKTIRGNCNIQIYIGSDDQKTKEEFSKLCGDITVKTNNRTLNHGTEGKADNTSVSTSQTSRPLIYPDELGHLPPETVIVKIFNEFPIKTKMNHAYKCSMFNMKRPADVYTPNRALDESHVRYDVPERNAKKIKRRAFFDDDE